MFKYQCMCWLNATRENKYNVDTTWGVLIYWLVDWMDMIDDVIDDNDNDDGNERFVFDGQTFLV